MGWLTCVGKKQNRGVGLSDQLLHSKEKNSKQQNNCAVGTAGDKENYSLPVPEK